MLKEMAIVLEWIGTFFLAVEAIKLENLANLQVQLHRLRRSLDPIRKVTRAAPDYGRAEKIAQSFLFLWLMIGFAAVYLVATVRKITPEGAWAYMTSVLPFLRAHEGIMQIVAVLIALNLAVLLGLAIYLALMRLLQATVYLLGALQKNTANGIVGILGFAFFSIACIIKLNGGE